MSLIDAGLAGGGDNQGNDRLRRRHDGSLITDVFFCVKIVQSWSHKSVAHVTLDCRRSGCAGVASLPQSSLDLSVTNAAVFETAY